MEAKCFCSRKLSAVTVDGGKGSHEDQYEKERVVEVARLFAAEFGRAPTGVVRAPGRVNLIGEHVDYEGYAVLPMAIQQSVYVAFSTIPRVGRKVSDLRVVNGNAKFSPVTIAISPQPQKNDESMDTLVDQEGWSRYVLCGALGVRDAQPKLFQGDSMELQFFVDGDIPAGCGLSSSSALVVAAALATTSALQPELQRIPSRMEMAELCRRAEQRVGTMSGGMDQTIACLGQLGVALHLDFSSVPTRCTPVVIDAAATGLTFVVVNSLVVAEKAVDAPTRYNKRVVECALAAKVIAKRVALANWRSMDRLVDVQKALEEARGESVSFRELQVLATVWCPLEEYSLQQLEEELEMSMVAAFASSPLKSAVPQVVTSATAFKLQQRAHHVWGEAERVEQFRTACTAITKEQQQRQLGEIMLASHRSCQELYECSCPELDALVSAAMASGALGARLTGAGWGGCIVVLVAKTEADNLMAKLRTGYYAARGITADSNVMFESSPAPGADLFIL